MRLLVLALVAFCVGSAGASQAQKASPSSPYLWLEFGKTAVSELSCKDRVSNREIPVFLGVPVANARNAVEFSGAPSQGILVGPLDIHPPLTLTMWLWRNPDAPTHESGVELPEYIQELKLGKGRIIGAASGTPSSMSGGLKIGPEKLEVWHKNDHWSTVIQGPLAAGEWIHIAITFAEDQTATGYLNGMFSARTKAGFNFESNPVKLFSASLARQIGHPFAGRAADIRIYRGILALEEIAALAADSPQNN